MDKIPYNILKSIKELIIELENNDIPIEQAILFGSYAKGNFDKYSDIDLALVSGKFSGNRFLDKEKIRHFIAVINPEISPLPFRTEDFTTDDFLVHEILKQGIKIIQ